MFFTYLGRELRRRARQASMIAIGLALGIGLVITVTALSAGVKNAQGQVLHSLYGVGTDITVTKTPTASSGGPARSASAAQFGTRARGKGRDQDRRRQPGQRVARQDQHDRRSPRSRTLHNVAAARGGLTLTDTKISGQDPVLQLLGRERRRVPRRRWPGGRRRHLPRVLTPSCSASPASISPRARSARSARASSPPAGPSPSADASANVAVLNSSYATAEQAEGRLGRSPSPRPASRSSASSACPPGPTVRRTPTSRWPGPRPWPA